MVEGMKTFLVHISMFMISLSLFHSKVLPYWIAQHIGAFFGAVVVYGVYIGM